MKMTVETSVETLAETLAEVIQEVIQERNFRIGAGRDKVSPNPLIPLLEPLRVLIDEARQ